MTRLRLLLVDDSAAIRSLVSSALADQPDIEIVGVATDGRAALQLVPQVRPDVILLDVEMPVLDGLETLAALRRDFGSIPVIMFSSLTEKGTATTIKALFLGASDFAAKPAGVANPDAARREVREILLPKLRGLRRATPAAVAARPGAPPVDRRRVSQPIDPLRSERVDIVAIGSSTGGPAALVTVLKALRELPVPMVITQHMPPLFTRLLVESLGRECAFPVREGVAGQRLDPGTIWLAPGDYHMEAAHTPNGTVIRLHQGPKENACRPSVDVLFASVARSFGRHALGVVLTGIGEDGLRGAREIKREGGVVLAQDEATSVVWGMPRVVAEAGLADSTLPLGRIADHLTRRMAVGRPALPSLRRERV